MAHANTYDLLAPMERWTAPNTELRVDSRFMESYAIQEADLATQVVTAMNSEGELEVFGVHPADGDLINYYPDSTSDTGWSQASVGITNLQWDYQLAAGRNAEGNLIVFVLEQGGLTYVVEDPQSDTRWSAPQQIQLEVYTGKIVCKNINGKLYLGINSYYEAENNYTIYTYAVCWDSSNPALPAPHVSTGHSGAAVSIGLTAGTSILGPQVLVFMNSGNIYPVLIQSKNQAVSSDMSPNSGFFGLTETGLKDDSTLLRATVVDDASGNPKAFGIWSNGNLSFNQCSGDWSWKNIANSASRLLGLRAIENKNGQLELFALGEGHNGHALNHIRQDSASPNGWSQLVSLGLSLSNIAIARNSDGYSELFGVCMPDIGKPGTDSPVEQLHTILHIWENPDTTDWEIFRLQTEAKGKMEKFISYSTELTVFDAEKLPSPNQEVKVWSPDLTFLTINGETYQVDDKTPAVCQTNIGGQLTITSKTNTLSAPLLKVWTGLMEPNDSVVIEPNLEIQDRLKTVSPQELLEAKGSDDNYLLQGKYRNNAIAETMAQGITRSMSLVSPTIGTNTNYLNIPGQSTRRQNLRTLSQNDPNFSHKIDMSAVPNQHWKMDFSSGVPVFTEMTREEAEASINETIAAIPDGGFLGIDWGSLWQSIRSGVNKLVHWHVTIVEEGIRVVINFGKTVWDGIISFVEQAFDLVQGIFEYVKVRFEQLFEWLGYLFDWQDILRMKEAIKHTVNEGFGVMQGFLEYVKKSSNTFFTQLGNKIDSSFEQMIQNQLGQQDLAWANDVPSPPGVEKSSSHNVVNSAFMNNLSNTGKIETIHLEALSKEALEPINNLINKLDANYKELEKKSQFRQALDFFDGAISEITKNPEQALRYTLAGILKVISGLAQLAVDLVKGVIDLILSALSSLISLFQNFLTSPWNIPFVSDLYSYITDQPNESLSALELVSLIIAIPVTVIYKIKCPKNEWVFPNQESVKDFKSSFTSEKILTAMGINNSGVSSQMTKNNVHNPSQIANDLSPFLKVLGCINAFSYISYAGITAYSDSREVTPPLTPPTPAENRISVVCIITEFTIWITGCPYFGDQNDNSPPGFGNPAQVAGLIWGFNMIFWVVDASAFLTNYMVFRVGGKKASLSGDPFVGTVFVFSIFNIGGYVILAVLQKMANQLTCSGTAVNFLSALPGLAGILRLSVIGGDPKYKKVALPTLSAIDVLCNVATGIISFNQAFPGHDAPKITEHPKSQTVTANSPVTFTSRAGVFALTAPSSLTAGEFLLPGQFLISPNYGYQLIYQTDGNLVLYRGDDTI